jgi:glucose/arabinose dehydrogenase
VLHRTGSRAPAHGVDVRVLALALLVLLQAPAASAQIASEIVVTNLTLPVRLVAPVGDARLFVAEQGGLIKVFGHDGSPRGVFLDLTALTRVNGERGLLGLAFAPDYATSGRFFVHYVDLIDDARIVSYIVDPANPDRALPASAQPVLTIGNVGWNHRGGHIEFGPDGMLYIGMGDGGSAANSQDPSTLTGKLLRIDVSGVAGYSIPPDNPFVGLPPRDEIWMSGLRNPWGWSFDRATGDLYVADVGQSTSEEVDVFAASSGGGENCGWPLMEGPNCYQPLQGCNDGSLTLPVYAYDHTAGRCSISGGYVYRGSAIPALHGRFLFGDFCSGQIWSLTWTPGGGVGNVTEWTNALSIGGASGAISAFGQDGFGELYVIEIYGGRARRIVAATSAVDDVPARAHLDQNFPNPFNPITSIPFVLPAGGGRTTLRLYDLAGRLVRTLVDEVLAEGEHETTWSGTDDGGRVVPAGSYLYRLECNGLATTRKLTLLE